jgi:hypothetical protein
MSDAAQGQLRQSATQEPSLLNTFAVSPPP